MVKFGKGHEAIENQQEDDERAQNAAGPKGGFGHGDRRRSGWHERSLWEKIRQYENIRKIESSGVAGDGLFDIDHPGDPEAVGKHTETLGPEGFGKRHGDANSVFRKGVKDALGLRYVA